MITKLLVIGVSEMRDLNYLNDKRIAIQGDLGDSKNGAFLIKIKGEKYYIIASNGGDWEHVSVSHKHKVPSWKIMCAVKEMFFEDNEVVMQLHPTKENYININENVLHLWKPVGQEIPTPPIEFV
jgi:hypothetical protein